MSYDLARLRRNGLIERPATQQHLHSHHRRPARRPVLHQGQQPVPAPPPGSRQTAGTGTTTPSAGNHRPPHQRLHRRSPDEKRCL